MKNIRKLKIKVDKTRTKAKPRKWDPIINKKMQG